ncbi:unnamed protein product [Rhodiola kirilowii]
MESLSSSVSTFRASALPLPAFKPSSPSRSNYHRHHQQPHLLPRQNSISNKQQPNYQQPQTLINNPLSQSPPSIPSRTSSSSTTHHRTSSGYAAALLDISLCQNSADLVIKDAATFARLIRSKPVLELMRNPFIDEMQKKQALNELAEKGKFEKHLAALLKMLIVKNKFAIISDVLDEFRRMYAELYRAPLAQ